MKIIHIMKDGSVKESIDGTVIPDGEFYQVLRGILERKDDKKCAKSA